MVRSCLPALSLVVALAATPRAQDMNLGQARVQVAALASAFGDGWTLTHEVVTGALHSYARDTVQVRLRAGLTYAIAATCDQDCSDIDLELIDPSGRVVSDLRPDDVPVVIAYPVTGGTYRVRVVMASCSVGPCRYAVGVFGR